MNNKIPKVIGLICIAIMVAVVIELNTFCCDEHTAKICFYDNVTSHDYLRGYNPVTDASNGKKSEWGLPLPAGNFGTRENLHYKKWCEETFINGGYVYEAYKEIAFNIKYAPEKENTDFWQTPSETIGINQGDCEDAVLLFFSHLSPQQKYAEIVWGWVFDRESMVGRAHVWYQIKDKNGLKYVVEGFSQDWNGIIPVAALELDEIRKPIFVISHATIGSLVISLQEAVNSQRMKLEENFVVETSFRTRERTAKPFSQKWAALFSLPDSDLFERVINKQHRSRVSARPQMYFNERNLALNMKEISNILSKLHEVLSRHVNQTNVVIAHTSNASQRGEAKHFYSNRDLTCRR